MAYSASAKRAIGAVRAQLARIGVTRQSDAFRVHGRHDPAPDAPLLLVACSGGRDSMALAQVAHVVAGMLGVRCGAAIIDHGMQAGSADVAAVAAGRCRLIGLDPVIVRRVDVDASASAGGPESGARDARYRALADIARRSDARAVLLAHTLDDQAETVLLGLIRGSGPGAACGMPCRSDHDGVAFLRPLLDLTRADTTSICVAAGVDWWDDPTNGDGYAAGEIPADLPLRSQLRHTVMPALAALGGPAVAAHMARAADAIRQDDDYLNAEAVRVAKERHVVDMDSSASPGRARIDASALAGLPRPLRTRIIARTLRALGMDAFTSRHVERIDALAADWHGQGSVRLPRGFSAFSKNHVIEVCQDKTHANR